MRPSPRPRATALLLLLPLLIAGCASAPPLSSPGPQPLTPPLPMAARQPPTPPECLPTCSDALTSARGYWLASPTSAELPGAPASAPMTP